MRERNFCVPNKRSGVQVASLLIVIAGVDAAKAEGFYIDVGVIGSTLGTDAFVDPASGRSMEKSDDDRSVGWKVGGGYRIMRSLAVELGYADFGDVTADPLFVTNNSFSVSYHPRINITGPYAALVGLLPIDQWDLFAKVGALRAETDITTREVVSLRPPNYIPRTYTEWTRSSADTTELLLGIGATYRFTDRYAVTLDATHVPKVGDGDITGQDDLTSLSLTARYTF